jgi:tRNA nucleotidyltransferase (CCA-adding enzyme)
MQVYMVGGAVRDALLGRTVHERDWVVVGSHPQVLLDQGYRSVGRDFPVFLHPTTHEEYALARTERKTGPGYTGFACYAAPDVTLEQDLHRRDFTMNAIAQNEQGLLVDPFGGVQDIKNRVIRHVSAAFAEDPVRLLRAARFAAQLPAFSIHPDTLQLMSAIVESGEAKHVTAERVWQECAKALQAPAPWRFFTVLQACGFLSAWDAGVALDLGEYRQLCLMASDAMQRWALLWAAATDEATVRQLNQQWRVPKKPADLLRLFVRWCDRLHNVDSAEELLACLQGTDALRFPKRFMTLVATVALHASGQPISEHQSRFWEGALAVLQEPVSDGMPHNLLGAEIKQWVQNKRLERMKIYWRQQ